MRAAFSQAFINYDITLRFIVENVRQFFEPDDPAEGPLINEAKRRTEPFGPNLYIECKLEDTADGEPCLSCRLYAGTTPYRGPITWSICGESLAGDTRYFQYSLTHTFVPSVGIGWRQTLSKAHWEQLDTLREENAICISATLRAREGPTSSYLYRSDATLAVSYAALTQSQPNDLSFVTYRARRTSGQFSDRRALFANADIIRETCPRLAKYLRHPHRACYGLPELFSGLDEPHSNFESDDYSDFEDDDTEEIDSLQIIEGPDDEHSPPETQEPGSEKAEDDHEAGVEYESWHASTSTSPLPDNWQWCFEESKSTEEAVRDGAHDVLHNSPSQANSSPILPTDGVTIAEEVAEDMAGLVPLSKLHDVDSEHESPLPPPDISALDPTIVMRTITVVGAASPTWEAFLFYLYTGEVIFAPLKSMGEVSRRVFIAHHRDKYPRQPAPCSPKSMYRLAHLLEMKELQHLALKNLEEQISKENVVAEIFTKFTSRYEEVQKVELHVLREHWEELKHTEQVSDVSARIVRGELPHVTGVLAALVPLVRLCA